MWKGCAAGNAGRNGIFASLLAREGLTGPLNAIEEKEGGLWSLLGPFEWEPFGGRGGPFRIALTNLKYFPSEYHSQSAISAALQLRDKLEIDAIESITIHTYWMAWNGIGSEPEKWHPTTRETADHSLPYIVAAALIDGTIEPETFSEERIADPQLRALIQKITVRENPEFTKQYPNVVPCRIEVVSSGGKRQVADINYPRGHAKNPMTDAEIENKFCRMCSSSLAPAQVKALLKSLWALDEVDDVGDVIELFACRNNHF
jgi:2-methylcitrate dehydratase